MCSHFLPSFFFSSFSSHALLSQEKVLEQASHPSTSTNDNESDEEEDEEEGYVVLFVSPSSPPSSFLCSVKYCIFKVYIYFPLESKCVRPQAQVVRATRKLLLSQPSPSSFFSLFSLSVLSPSPVSGFPVM